MSDSESVSSQAAPPPVVEVLRDPAAVAERVAECFRREAVASVEARDHFYVSLAGGKTPKLTYSILNSMHGIPWRKLQLFMGDECAVPLNDELSNYRMVRRRLLEDIAELVGHVHHLSTFERSLEDVALKYQHNLEEILGPKGKFDLMLVGVRSDGSTMGLIPGRPESRALDRLVVAVQDPGDGPDRVSLGLQALLQARQVWVVAVGAVKAEIVKRVLAGDADTTDCPAAWLARLPGQVSWFLDQAAARNLDRKDA